MALKTKVGAGYRTPYMGKEVPADVLKIMRREISVMRVNLLGKQNALAKSKYGRDTSLTEYLTNLTVSDIHGVEATQNTWARLRNLELSNRTSVAGRKLSTHRAVVSYQNSGLYFINEENADAFGRFMGWTQEQYSRHALSSSVAVQYFKEHADLSVNELEAGFHGWLQKNYGWK